MGTIDHKYLRPVKAMRRQIMIDSPFPKRLDLQTQTVDHATILPVRDLNEVKALFGRGGVMDSEGNYVPLSALPRRVDGSYDYENPEYRDQKVVYCGFMVPQWGHFLVEGVTRLWYFLENDPTIDRYVFVLNENEEREIKGNYREFLELLGIWDKLDFINQPTTYRQVLIPEIAYQCQTFYSQKYLDIYDRVAENVIADPAWSTPEKIYFSRSQLRFYGDILEFGHDLLDNYHEVNGFLRLHPENLSLRQTIHYIRNAKIISTLSGSAEHNVLFARNGQTVYVLERLVLNDDHQADIDRIRGLNVTYVDASTPLYPTDFGGPSLLGYSECLEQFTKDLGYAPPDSEFLTEKYRKRCFASYMQTYWLRFHYCWFMEEWYSTCTDCIWEGYKAGYAIYKDYLEGKKPYLLKHYFSLHYLKQNLKFILKKWNLYHG